MTGSQVSLGKGFGELMWYLTEKKPERVSFIDPYNVSSTQPEIVAKQMEQTASQSRRCQQPLYHTSLNWHPDDQPTKEQMKTVAEEYLDHMGLAEHQAIVVAHHDTDHAHVHIAVNRIHPERGKAWELDTYIGQGRDRKKDQLHNERVQNYLDVQEREYGWHRVEGKYRTGREIAVKASPTRSEYHRQQRKKKKLDVFGMDSEELDMRSPRLRAMDVGDKLFDCQSFRELDQVLDGEGLWIEAKGQGAVFTDGVHSVKASEINRHLSGPQLEEQFGEALEEYLKERKHHIDSELGYRQLVDWTRDLQLKELKQLAHIKKAEKKKAEIKKKHFGFLESQFDNILNRLPRAFEDGYQDGKKVYKKFGHYLNEYNGRPQEAIAELVANPEKFGIVQDPGGLVGIDEIFREALDMQGKVKEYVNDLTGPSFSDKKQQLTINIQKAKQELRRVNKKIITHLKSDHREVLQDRQAEQAKRTVKGGMYKALSLHRAIDRILSGAESKRNKELSTFTGNVGLLLSNPGRGSAKILEQAVKVASQELLKKERGLERSR